MKQDLLIGDLDIKTLKDLFFLSEHFLKNFI